LPSLLVLASIACAPPIAYQPTATSEVFAAKDFPALGGDAEAKIKSVVDRAPFDLNCPAEEISYSHVGEVGKSYMVGVTGCGRRALYQYVYGAGWVMNSASED